MIRIGITGGIGSGKSIVASLLTLYGIPVYIADNESKKLTDTSIAIKTKLIELFGNELYTENGLNKKLLASYIFGKKDVLDRVNSIIHPEVQKDFENWTNSFQCKACGIESAILFESGFYKMVDVKLMVYAPLEVRIRRAVERDNTCEANIMQRIKSQIPDEEKCKRSDFVIKNDGFSALIPQIENFLLRYGL